MTTKPIPEGYHTVTPYLVVPGVPRLIEFLQRVFDAREVERMAHEDGTIMHAEVQIGNSRVMMGEPTGQMTPMPAMLYVYVDDPDATWRRALDAGAVSVMEPKDQFYGDRSAGVRDPMGNQWWVAAHKEDVPPDEMARRAEAAMKQRSER